MTADLDIDLLRAFVAVAETGGFTRAAGRLNRGQSAVSMQIKRLEDVVGQRLFARTRRSVALTAEGEVLLGYARRMLQLNAEAIAELGEQGIEGPVRLGATDISSVFLPAALSRFAETYPRAQLEVVCDRSWNILGALEAEELDLALATQSCGRTEGRVVRREPLVWAAARDRSAHEQDPLPLALYAEGCVYRQAALKALDVCGRRWRIAYSSASHVGVQAAVSAGLAVGVQGWSTLGPGLRALGADEGFPALPPFELSLHTRPGPMPAPVRKLGEAITAALAAPLPEAA